MTLQQINPADNFTTLSSFTSPVADLSRSSDIKHREGYTITSVVVLLEVQNSNPIKK